jgi:hypothetical protein
LAYGVLNTFFALMDDEEIVDPIGPAPANEVSIEGLIAEFCQFHQLS